MKHINSQYLERVDSLEARLHAEETKYCVSCTFNRGADILPVLKELDKKLQARDEGQKREGQQDDLENVFLKKIDLLESRLLVEEAKQRVGHVLCSMTE